MAKPLTYSSFKDIIRMNSKKNLLNNQKKETLNVKDNDIQIRYS